MNSPPNTCYYEFEGYVLDPLQRVVRTLADGQMVRLTARAFDALQLLVEDHGQLVDKETLIKALWPKVIVEENNLTQIIHSLRQTLGEKPGERRFIVTAPGRGYRFVAAVKEVSRVEVLRLETPLRAGGAMNQQGSAIDSEDWGPPPVSEAVAVPGERARVEPLATPSTERADARTNPGQVDPVKVRIEAKAPAWWRKTTRTQATAAAAVAALALLVGAFALWQLGGRTRTLEPSIAVLPFANLTGDPTKDYMAHGIAGELIGTLSQIDRLKVIGRGSSFSYSPDADPRKVGPALNVANILSGTVSQKNGGVRISFELADASSGRTILSKTYTAALTTDNIAAAQRYVAEQVAGALSIAFDIRGGRQLLGAGTRSLEAYDYYLQGREVMGSGPPPQSEHLFAKAVAADPNYGAAWGLMAIAHGSRSWFRPTLAEGRAEQDAAYAMAKKAVTLDPNISTSQAVLANLATTQHNWSEAETASVLALDLSVNEIALGQRQLILLRAGRVTEADALYRALEEVAPHGNLGAPKLSVWTALGRLNEVRAMVESPDWAQTGNVSKQVRRLEALIDLGGPADAVRDALEVIARQPDRTLSEFAKAVLAVFANKEKARRVLQTWYDGPGFDNALKYELIPFLAAWYGDTDLVLRVWRDDLPVNVVRMTQLWGPAYAPARSSPSFKILMQDMGLVDYWRTYGWANKCRPVGASDFECG